MNTTIGLGIRLTFMLGVKPKNLMYGGRCIQHQYVIVNVDLFFWSWSKRFWLWRKK